jgi:hypothetical protein
MQHLSIEETADFLESVTIERTFDLGHVLVHLGNVGTDDSPARFVLMTDSSGRTTLAM